MSRIRRRRRSRREVAARRRFVVGLILFLLALAAAIYFNAADYLPPLEPVPSSASIAPPAGGLLPVRAANAVEREIYPYSVIDGGAASREELKEAMARDPIVAAHYSDFAIGRTRVERLTQPRLAHVSYRIGNSIFWTRNPVMLKAGEQVLTDGRHVARTRCGNQLADKPGDVSPMEPAPGVMDVPLNKPGTVPAIALLPSRTTFPGALGPPLGPHGATLPSAGGTTELGGSPGVPFAGLGVALAGSAEDPGTPDDPSTASDDPADPFDLPNDSAIPPTIPAALPPPGSHVPPLIPPDVHPFPPGTDLPIPPFAIDPGGSRAPEPPAPIPEPGTALLIIAGGAAYVARRFSRGRRG